MLNEHERPIRMDDQHDDAREPVARHDHDDHEPISFASETADTARRFPVLEEPTWLDAEEDDEELEEPRDSAFRGIWIGIGAAAVTFVMVFAIPHWLGWYDIGPSKAKREVNPEAVVASASVKSPEAPAPEPAAATAPLAAAAPAAAPAEPAKAVAPPAAEPPPAAVEPRTPEPPRAARPPREARPAPREIKPAPAHREVKAAAAHERRRPKGKTYSVQIAAFKNARQANKAAATAKRAGYSADVLKVDSSVPWVVRIGGYSTREQAESARDALARRGFRGGFIL